MITLTLTTQDLERHNACPPAMTLFSVLTEGRGSITVEWTPLHALWLAAAHPAYAGWLVERGLVPAISLTRANLTRANLTGANLTGANLGDADLRGGDLSDADLRGADLRDANLSEADLSRAKLRGGDLSDADLTGADLTGADLRGAVVATGTTVPGWTATAMLCGCCTALTRGGTELERLQRIAADIAS
jgi:uncharacterized protein YjbI with pentapeptide repeats